MPPSRLPLSLALYPFGVGRYGVVLTTALSCAKFPAVASPIGSMSRRMGWPHDPAAGSVRVDASLSAANWLTISERIDPSSLSRPHTRRFDHTRTESRDMRAPYIKTP